MSGDSFDFSRLRGVRVLHLSAADSMLNPNLMDQLRYLRDLGMVVGTASMDGALARQLQNEEHFDWQALPMTREFAPLSDLRAVHDISARLKRQCWDIVHTHTPKGNLVGQWAAKLAGVPYVVQTLHGYYFHDRMAPWLRRAWIEIERFSARHSDAVLFQNSEDLQTALHECIVPAKQARWLGNGIDLQRFKPVDESAKHALRTRAGVPASARIVGMVGRFVREKGIREFLAAARSLSVRLADVHFMLVGHQVASERQGDALGELAIPAELRGRLSVFTNRTDVPELVGCMDVNVLASYREGFPRVLCEGSACGLPQVATGIRGCRQAIENGLTGWLVEPKNAVSLARRIEDLLEDEVLRRKFGIAARFKAEAEFDQVETFKRVADCYVKLILGN